MPERKRVNVAKSVVAEPVRKPKLGQHFLDDHAAAVRIVEALGDLSQATVLEIGPGRGALTSLLAARGRRIIAVELDRVMSAQLRMKFSTYSNVEVIEGDILKIELDTVFGPKPGLQRPGMAYTPEPAYVVGNLPYYITSEILLRLLEYHRYFSTIVIMVQKEVADRLQESGTSLSGGQQQRLCIARTIAVNPEVILMDEPCSALDPIATARIEDLIDELRASYAIVIVTHSMQQAARVSQRTAYFHLGDLIEVGETDRVFTNPRHKLTEDYITGRFG